MIRLEIIGNIGKDAEEKKFGDSVYASFSVCHTEKRGDKEFTTWVNCLKKDDNGKLLPYLKKGTKVYASGSPKANAYINREGQAVGDLQLNVFSLELCGGKKDSDEHPYTQGSPMGEAPTDEGSSPF